MEKLKAYRQGDLAFIQIEKLPKELKASKTDIVLQTGSGGNPHSFKGGTFYPKVDGDFVIGYLKAKGTKLYHIEHSPKGDKIEDRVYEVRRQVEHTHQGMVQVVD